MAKYHPGDHVKVEISDTDSGQSEWLWMIVDSCDDDAQLVFGRLDNVPVVTTHLRVGHQLAVSFENVREVLTH